MFVIIPHGTIEITDKIKLQEQGKEEPGHTDLSLSTSLFQPVHTDA
jgi:hypothetical protein